MIDKTQTAQEFIPLPYQVVCEYCRKMIFFPALTREKPSMPYARNALNLWMNPMSRNLKLQGLAEKAMSLTDYGLLL
ncbi:hypothetical protein [Desulfosporosinus youngiae]|uniref:Uncharacterized protein n=1 Tax=Desulfosporosinus youngiae DSM 17734 TaxID=768710 RepID=H5XTL0_9FIRM|nr:hypothetical protein [Desulfosporosinus youngiae]EHQ88609.1 hypothetical protein DesyoDRAFT_1455 [Desulfosporosinus youngiae DSM 17734]